MWALTLPDIGVLAWTVLFLVILEGLLSADNALVLAVMVRHLPKEGRKHALRYGIIGAFGFRAIAVLFAASLLDFWFLKLFGGLYLLYLATSHLLAGVHGPGDDLSGRAGHGFWRTVFNVEVADIAFSIDSILAAVAMADGLRADLRDTVIANVWGFDLTIELAVVYAGGILGIITMRFVAGYFLLLLERFSGLAAGAYVLVAWIGLKLIGEGIHTALHPTGLKGKPIILPAGDWRLGLPESVRHFSFEMSDLLFWGGMFTILAASMLYRPKVKPSQEAGSMAEIADGDTHA
jgi:YkoY family integral membrane protein